VIPQEILTFATMMRANFGQGVRLLYWADSHGNEQGRPENDFDSEAGIIRPPAPEVRP